MIDVLLSTYNGERFLAPQLDSLLSQTYGDFRIIVRDDRSTDGTADILRRYTERHPDKITVIYGDTNIGYIRSFEHLLALSTADYAMFCDQDDIWLPDKIKISLDRLLSLEQLHGHATPILVHTDLELVGEHLEKLHPSFVAYSGIPVIPLETDIHYLCLCNTVTGCASIFNRALISVALPFRESFVHDAWMAVCAKLYGQIDFIPRATILYRQHVGNSIGAHIGGFSIRQRLSSLKKVMDEARGVYITNRGLVYRNILHFLYYKTLYTLKYRIF